MAGIAASGSVPAVSVPAKLLEFSYDGLSRRIRKKVQEKPAGGSTWSIVKWEAYVYDGWNMVMTVNLNPTVGGSCGRAQSRVASYVWGPDIGSPVTARSDWQRAGGVGGLLMAVYPVAATGSVPTFEQWMTSEGYNPLLQEGSNEWEDALWNYQSIWGSNINVHVPVMDHMGNVLGVTRLAATPGSGGTATSEYVYDYDAFGKEMRSSSLVANGNPDSFPFHYSTKFTDGETGLNYYGYRYLDTQRGRWINRDPIGERGGVNLFGLVGNDGVNHYDLLGLQAGQTTPQTLPGQVQIAETLGEEALTEVGRQAMREGLRAAAIEARKQALKHALKRAVKHALTDVITKELNRYWDSEYEGSGDEDLEKKEKCITTHAEYKNVQDRRIKRVGKKPLSRLKRELAKPGCDTNKLCREIQQIIDELGKEIAQRQSYVDDDCDEWDWEKKGNTTAERRAKHEEEIRNKTNSMESMKGLANKYCNGK